MCKFVKVTCAESKSVSYLNMDIVQEIKEMPQGTYLFFSDNDFITVEETPGQIMNQIAQIQRSKQ